MFCWELFQELFPEKKKAIGENQIPLGIANFIVQISSVDTEYLHREFVNFIIKCILS